MSDQNEEGLFSCTNMCWIVGALIAIAAWFILNGQMGMGMVLSIIIAIVIGVVAALVLKALFCGDAEEVVRPPAHAAANPASEPAPSPKAKPAEAEEKQAEPKVEAPKAAVTGGDKPETLSGPRNGNADDLKRIKGVGPGLEKTLNELGFYHFDQVAAWGPQDVEWVDERLKFKGRIERDNWIKQAADLAKEDGK